MWGQLAREAVAGLQEGQFTALTGGEAREVLEGRKLGVARLRLLPKRAGGPGGPCSPVPRAAPALVPRSGGCKQGRAGSRPAEPAACRGLQACATSSTWGRPLRCTSKLPIASAVGAAAWGLGPCCSAPCPAQSWQGIPCIRERRRACSRACQAQVPLGQQPAAKRVPGAAGCSAHSKRARLHSVSSCFHRSPPPRALAQVLRYETAAQPEALGASVFGYNDIFCRLQPFLRKWRAAAAAAAAAGAPPLQPYIGARGAVVRPSRFL